MDALTPQTRADPLPAGLIDAVEATARLRISRATLYAYVSRGLIRSVVKPDDPRAHLYAAADIAMLARRKTRMRRPAAAAATALDWGLPVLETRIARIENGRLSYRGADATTLAETQSFEQVCRRLWDAGRADPFKGVHFDPGSASGWTRMAARVRSWPATDRAMALLSLILDADRDGKAPFHTAARLVLMIATAAAGTALDPRLPLHRALAKAWDRPKAADAIRRALILSADHELNVSTFAVRVVASSGASLTASLLAGLAALSGPRHGGATLRAAKMIAAMSRSGGVEAVLRDLIKRDVPIPGFGHPLYPDGDPRAEALLPHIGTAPLVRDAATAIHNATGQHPTIDLALVGVELGQRLPPGAALALFAIGRTSGWIAHALEQQANQTLIRPRARFVADEPPIGTS
ncbi:MAG TPA: citrate synthase [Magnetospirillaceae bacterium]